MKSLIEHYSSLVWRRRALTAFGLVAFAGSSLAQNWNGSSSTLWGTAGNWTGTAPASSGSLDLTFSTANLTGAQNRATVNDLTGFTASSLTFSNTAGSPGFSLTGNQITLEGNAVISGSAGFPGPSIGLNMVLNGNRIVQVEAGSSAVIGGAISETGGARSLFKRGTGTLMLSSANSFTGGLEIGAGVGSGEADFGGTVILGHNSAAGSGTVTVQNTNSTLLLANGVSINNSIAYTSAGLVKTLGLQAGATSASLTGNLSFADVYGENEIRVLSGGSLNVSGNISGTGFSTSGRGMTVLSGVNTQSSSVAVSLGTLRLDYSTNNTSKLSDSGALFLGGKVDLAGGSHNEVVSSWTMNSGASAISRSSGASTISLGALTFNQGSTVDFASAGLATVTQNSTFGTTPTGWTTLGGTDWAVTSATGSGVAVLAYSAYTSVTSGNNLANNSNNHNLLSNGGSIGLASATTAIGTALLKSSTDATIDTAGKTLQTRGLMIAAGGGNLTVGTTANSGSLTRLGTSGATQLSLINYSSNTLLINSVIVNQTGSVSPFVTKSGSGLVTLAANNAYTGTTYANEGTLLLTGNNTGNGAYEVRGNLMVNGSIGTGAVTVYDGSTLGGSGTIEGATTLQQGAKLSAGYNSADTLTLSNGLNLSATAGSEGVFSFTLGAAQDLVDVTGGTLSLGDHLLNFSSFNFALGAGITETSYTLFNSVSTSGSLAWDNLSGSLGGGYSGTLSLSGNDVIITVVPEPAATMLLACAGILFWLKRVRRTTAVWR